MDLQDAEQYMRAHWPAVLLMAVIVVPGTAGVVTFFRPDAAKGASQRPADDLSQAKLDHIEGRLNDLTNRIDALDRFYRWSRDDENRSSGQEYLKLESKSKQTAVIPSGVGATKGKP
jgi:hypothetical protein